MLTEGTKRTGKHFRVWMDMKASTTGKNSKAIFNSGEYGEDIAKDVYKKALKDDAENLTTE